LCRRLGAVARHAQGLPVAAVLGVVAAVPVDVVHVGLTLPSHDATAPLAGVQVPQEHLLPYAAPLRAVGGQGAGGLPVRHGRAQARRHGGNARPQRGDAAAHSVTGFPSMSVSACSCLSGTGVPSSSSRSMATHWASAPTDSASAWTLAWCAFTASTSAATSGERSGSISLTVVPGFALAYSSDTYSPVLASRCLRLMTPPPRPRGCARSPASGPPRTRAGRRVSRTCRRPTSLPGRATAGQARTRCAGGRPPPRRRLPCGPCRPGARRGP